MTRPVRPALAATLAATLALTTSCARIGEQSSAERINPDDLEGLVDQATTTTTTTTSPPDASSPNGQTDGSDVSPMPVVALYYVEGDVIVPVDVEVAPGTRERAVLSALEGDPIEAADGLRSELPAGLISGVRREGGRVTVNVDSEIFATTDARDHRLLFGQIVLTLTDLPEPLPQIAEVRFTVDDEPIAVPLRDDTLSERGAWVTWEDYERLLEPA